MDLHQWLSPFIINTTIQIFGYNLAVKISGYGTLITASSVVVYTLYIRRIFDRDIPPPIATWGLWVLLDLVTVISEFGRHSFNTLFVCYTIGSSIVTVTLFKHPNCSWDHIWDTVTSIVVVVSIIVFVSIDDKTWALITALTGITIATIPLARNLLNETNEPWKEPGDVWLISTGASVLTCLDGKMLTGAWVAILQFGIFMIIMRWNLKRRNLRIA
jgi:hypothetical protein